MSGIISAYPNHTTLRPRKATGVTVSSISSAPAVTDREVERWLRRLGVILELAVIGYAAWRFTIPIHHIGPDYSLPGREHQRLSGVILPVRTAWLDYREFAMWNPYLYMGEPLVANPFNYLWNLVASLPVLLWGGAQGTAIGAMLTIAVAGIGMWLWAQAMGFGYAGRLFCGLLYLVSGGLISKFGIGHYQLGLSLGWIPWPYAGLFFALRDEARADRRWFRLSVILMAFGVAMTFLSGNIFYTLPLALSFVIIAVVYLIEPRPDRKVGFGLDGHVIKALALGLILILGLSAIQLIPVYWVRHYIGGHPNDTLQEGSQPLAHALLNYLVSDENFYRSRQLGLTPWLGDSYAYIGVLPFVLLILTPLAAVSDRRRRKPIIILFLLLGLMLAWAGNQHNFIGRVYERVPFLYQFRFPGRFHAMGALFLIILSGYGVQTLWDLLARTRGGIGVSLDAYGQTYRNVVWVRYQVLSALALLLLLVGGVLNVARENQELFASLMPVDPNTDRALRWLKSYDDGVYYVYLSQGLDAYNTYNHRVRFFNMDEGWKPDALPSRFIVFGQLEATPHYQIMALNDPPPYPYNAIVYDEEVTIYDVSNPVPFAYTVRSATLQVPGAATPDKLQPVEPVTVTANRMVFSVAEDEVGQHLVVSVIAFPGWRVRTELGPAPLEPVGRYLGVALLPGAHTYTFVYSYTPFWVGLMVTLLTLGVCLVWAFGLPAPPSVARGLGVLGRGLAELGRLLWARIWGRGASQPLPPAEPPDEGLLPAPD